MAQVNTNGEIDTTNLAYTRESINGGSLPRQPGAEPFSRNRDSGTTNPVPGSISFTRETEGAAVIPDELYSVAIRGNIGYSSNDNYAILRKAAPDETGDPYDLDPTTAPYVGFFHFGDPSIPSTFDINQ